MVSVVLRVVLVVQLAVSVVLLMVHVVLLMVPVVQLVVPVVLQRVAAAKGIVSVVLLTALVVQLMASTLTVEAGRPVAVPAAWPMGRGRASALDSAGVGTVHEFSRRIERYGLPQKGSTTAGAGGADEAAAAP